MAEIKINFNLKELKFDNTTYIKNSQELTEGPLRSTLRSALRSARY